MNDQPATMYALLVGIDDYTSSRVPNLGGCVNDVDATEQLLCDKFNVPVENIKKLTNNKATHQAIKDAFKSHLIARANAWAGGPVPAFLFHYSGHGSQALDESGAEPDGLDETIVPHDSRVGNVFDIKDWELGQMIDELTKPFSEENANVTIILDCCHSGSGTRDIKPTLIPTRRCEPDLRSQPSRRPTDGVLRTRSVSTPSGWELGTKYVLLAGCRDREEANEYIVPQGKAGYRQHGAMTFFMLEELNSMSPDRPMTYREQHERIRYQVNSRYETQMPQCEGQKDRRIFGGLAPEREVMLTIVDKSEGLIWVAGGMAHGLTEGSQLYVYPPDTEKIDEAGDPIATLYVEKVGAVCSGCIVEKGPDDVEMFSRAVIAYIDHGDMQRQVVLDILDDGLRSEIEQLLSDDQVSPYVKLVPADQPANLRVQQVGDNLELQDSTGKPLAAAFPPDKRHELSSDLIHLARYHNALSLVNSAGYSELAGAVTVEIRRLAFDENNAPTTEPIEPNAEGETEIKVGQRIVVEITNHAEDDLFITAFNFAHDWSVSRLYPRIKGAHEALPGNGGKLRLGLTRKRREQLTPGLPKGVNEAREFIKVIATLEETDFELLQMGELKSPTATRSVTRGDKRSALTSLLEQAADGSGTRAIGAPVAAVEDEWMTAEIQFRLTRPLKDKAMTQSLRGGTTSSLSGYALEFEPPEGFQGQVRVLTARQNTRAAGGDLTDLAPPPGLAGMPGMFEPVELRSQGTRNVGPGGAVIEIEADEQARSAVTEETPLKMRLPLTGDGKAIMALAYDGSFFYPVGCSSKGQAGALNIEWLPNVAPPDEKAVRTRNIGRTIKLYLFKTLKWKEPSLGLNKARFVAQDKIDEDQPEPDERTYTVAGGEARYRPLHSGELKPDDRVALFVHGFSSETKGMVSGILPWLEENGLGYDHYLTFDYETFNTRIGQLHL